MEGQSSEDSGSSHPCSPSLSSGAVSLLLACEVDPGYWEDGGSAMRNICGLSGSKEAAGRYPWGVEDTNSRRRRLEEEVPTSILGSSV